METLVALNMAVVLMMEVNRDIYMKLCCCHRCIMGQVHIEPKMEGQMGKRDAQL